MKAYKAFDENWQCRGFQYEVGKTYVHDGEISLCNSGFHACEAPLDVFNYYPLIGSQIAEVELRDVSEEKADDSKRVAKSITVRAALNIAGIVSAQIEWVKYECKDAKEIALGAYSNAAAQGDSSKAAAQGDSSKAAAQGNYSNAAAQGDYSNAAAQGYSSKAAAQGYSSNAAAQGNSSNAAAQGYSSKAAAQGDYSNAAAQGDYSKAAAQGYSSNAVAQGEKTLAMVCGFNGTACAGKYGAIALPWMDGDQVRIAVGIIGEDGIKADTPYTVRNGKLVEVK